MPVRTGRFNQDALTYAVDLLLGGWRLRERTGLRQVGEPSADGRIVLCGNWALEVHRLESALRCSGGGHLLIIETEGHDLAMAVALGLIDGRSIGPALRDPDVLALTGINPGTEP